MNNPFPPDGGHDATIIPHPDSVRTAKIILAGRRRIARHFDERLFADPVRDILLDLFIADTTGRRVYVSSCCIAAAVPTTTALRWIYRLKNEGMIVETSDPTDNRRKYLSLSPETRKAMCAYLEEVAAEMRKA